MINRVYGGGAALAQYSGSVKAVRRRLQEQLKGVSKA